MILAAFERPPEVTRAQKSLEGANGHIEPRRQFLLRRAAAVLGAEGLVRCPDGGLCQLARTLRAPTAWPRRSGFPAAGLRWNGFPASVPPSEAELLPKDVLVQTGQAVDILPQLVDRRLAA